MLLATVYVLLCVKTVRGLDRAALMREAMGPNTVLTVIGNGIGIEQELADAFPRNELVSVLAFVAQQGQHGQRRPPTLGHGAGQQSRACLRRRSAWPIRS